MLSITQSSPPSPTAPGTASGSGNRITADELLRRATELGEQAGKGRDTQIKFLLSCLEGGYHGAIDLTPNKHGADRDDATRLAETYVKAQGTATVFDAKAANQRKLISTLRTSIKLGQWPVGGTNEPLNTVNELMAHRQTLRKDPAQCKKLDDAANTFLRFARAQLRSNLLIAGAELHDFCFKKVSDPATAEEKVEALRNSIKKLVEGDKNGVQDNSPKVKAAMRALTDRLVEIAQNKKK